MTSRLRKKRLRPAERMLAEFCRLYLTRPRDGDDAAELEELARSMVSLSLSILLREWTQVGPGRLRPWWVKELRIVEITEQPHDLRVTGTVEWSRMSDGKERVEEEAFGLVCAVPDRYRGDPHVRPVVLLARGDTGPI